MTSNCLDHSHLNAYYDGELDGPGRLEVERHIQACPACAAELEKLRDVSKLFVTFKNQTLSDDELARLHVAVDSADFGADESNQSALRLGWFLLAAAASVLIVCGAWLLQLPAAGTVQQARIPALPEWERVAMSLKVDPLPSDDGATRLAGDARMADWMVDQLQRK